MAEVAVAVVVVFTSSVVSGPGEEPRPLLEPTTVQPSSGGSGSATSERFLFRTIFHKRRGVRFGLRLGFVWCTAVCMAEGVPIDRGRSNA